MQNTVWKQYICVFTLCYAHLLKQHFVKESEVEFQGDNFHNQDITEMNLELSIFVQTVRFPKLKGNV